jgi:hypothetical protein
MGHSSARVTATHARTTFVRGSPSPRQRSRPRAGARLASLPPFPIPIVRAPQWFSSDLAPAHLRRLLRDGHASPRQRAAGVPRPLPPHQPPRVLQRHRGWGVPDLVVQRCEPTALAVARIHRPRPPAAREHTAVPIGKRASRVISKRLLFFFYRNSARFFFPRKNRRRTADACGAPYVSSHRVDSHPHPHETHACSR